MAERSAHEHAVPAADAGAMRVESVGGRVLLHFSGRLDAEVISHLWDEAMAHAASGRPVSVEAVDITGMDGSGMALLLKLRLAGAEPQGLAPRFQALMDMVDAKGLEPNHDGECKECGLAEQVGRMAGGVGRDTSRLIAFVGECGLVLFQALLHPRTIRRKDVLDSMVAVGVDSMPILLLIGFLMGLILSFQSAVSLMRFGAVIFVPNMLGLVMFREMGALITAILLAARSGSAFAAEIGTMKVNEEVDALVTMGLSPMRFLVAPKVIASLLMIPLMTMFFNFAALVGGAVVMLSLGFPLATFTGRVFSNTTALDFGGGMAKALVFSVLVAGVGCMRGMGTGSGAESVGRSTTGAVVSGLILIAVADGIFAVIFYYMGW
ncbi:MAG: ABC transporter permease [Desulfovibrionaceae bacterium]